MSVVVEVLKGEVQTVEFVAKKTGVAWVKKTQSAALHNGREYPELFDLRLAFFERGKQGEVHPYAPGRYVLAPESFKIDRNGAIVIDDRVRLVEESNAKLKAA